MLSPNGTIPIVGVPTPTGTPAATPTPNGTPTPTPGFTTVSGDPDESFPDVSNPVNRRPVWNAARVLGYTDPVADLLPQSGPTPVPADPDKAPALSPWPGRRMVWSRCEPRRRPRPRQNFNCPDNDTDTCSTDLVAALALTPTTGLVDDPVEIKARRVVQFLRGGKTHSGSRDEILNDLGAETTGTFGSVDPNTKYSYYYQDDQPMSGQPGCSPAAQPPGTSTTTGCTDGAVTPHGYAHKLGDIFHSEPAVLLPPKYFQYLSSNLKPRTGACGVLDDCTYGLFAAMHSKRRLVLLAGANDGFLHAFEAGAWGRDDGGTGAFTDGAYDLGTGREIFAYAPKAPANRFPSLIEFPRRRPRSTSWTARWPRRDVFIDTGDMKATARLKSVVVGGLRQGGNYYYALTLRSRTVDKATGIRGSVAADRQIARLL